MTKTVCGAMLLALLVVGCELGEEDDATSSGTASTAAQSASPSQPASATNAPPSGSPSATNTPPSSTPPAAATDDQAEWDAIQWQGASAKGATPVMSLTAKIDSAAKNVRFGFDRYPWSDMALAHFFVWDGSRWRGGKFDWLHTGGQSVKGLTNIYGHYNGLSAPPSGTPCAFAWTSADGKTRSNLAKTVWP